MAKNGNHLYLERKKVREQIARSYLLAKAGLEAHTVGPMKASARFDEARRAQITSRSRIAACHQEHLAILVADMRGSTKLAAAEKPEKMFVLMQCFIPLLGFITSSFNGEIVGLRGDGLIAAFGFGEGDWKTFINRAYEAGMVMIEASRDVLGPFLVREGVVAPNAVGVSIDGGQVTMTKIGFGDSVEVTAYGDAVNQAAKSCKGTNALSLSATINGRLHGVTAAETFAQKTSRLTGT